MSDAPSLPDGAPAHEHGGFDDGVEVTVPSRPFAALLRVGDADLQRVLSAAERRIARGDAGAARALLRRLVALDEGVPVFWCALVQACDELHDQDGARTAFAAAVKAERALFDDTARRARARAFRARDARVAALCEAAVSFADVDDLVPIV
jgi:hypothetical protein